MDYKENEQKPKRVSRGLKKGEDEATSEENEVNKG